MFVQILSRPLFAHSHLPQDTYDSMSSGLQSVGIRASSDIGQPVAISPTVLNAWSADLARQWTLGCPDIVHSVGVVATMAALKGLPRCPIVATFDEDPGHPELEESLARQVSAMIPLSSAEHRKYRKAGICSLWSGPFPAAIQVPKIQKPSWPLTPAVATHATGGDLLEIVASMPHWHGDLIVLGGLSAAQALAVRDLATGLGLQQRLSFLPGLTGSARRHMWARTSLLLASREGARHGGFVVEAAAHGVTSVALARGAHLDLISTGINGRIFARGGSLNLGRLLALALADSFALRAQGEAAKLAVASRHSRMGASERLAYLYEQALALDLGVGGSRRVPVAEKLNDERMQARDRLALENLPLARQLSGWYSGRGQSHDDLYQVACLGLITAAERFDPDLGGEFHSFAIPTILGEIRRHFRGNAWSVRVPRGLQESNMEIARSTERLGQQLGRRPETAEIAEHLGLSEEHVRRAVQAESNARFALSLDISPDDFSGSMSELDRALENVEISRDLRTLLGKLPEREQQILALRFFGERTQSEIGERLGMSQVQVSRLLSQTLAAIREHVLHDRPLPSSWHAEPRRIGPSRRGLA